MTLSVVPSELRRAARSMVAAGRTVQHQVPDEVGDVAVALPGSRSAPPATRLAAGWRARHRSWGRSVTRMGSAMRTAANTWHTVDVAVAARQEALMRSGVLSWSR